VKVFGEGVVVVACRRLARLAEPSAVISDHPVTRSQKHRELLLPGGTVQRISVDQNYRIARAMILIVQIDVTGVFFANIIWLPFENKIKVKANKEMFINEIIIEGLLSIQSGDSSRIIKDKLSLSLIEKMQKNPSGALNSNKEVSASNEIS
jgi:hypothetical protein